MSITINRPFYSCGKDLTSLYSTPAVQSFLNGLPARSLDSNRSIYQPGAARKESKCFKRLFCQAKFILTGNNNNNNYIVQ